MEPNPRNVLYFTLFGALAAFMVWWGLADWRESIEAEPVLKFQSTKAGKGHVEIELKSASNKTFRIYGLLYRIVRIVKLAPVVKQPADKSKSIQRARWFMKNSTADVQIGGYWVTPDKVATVPGPPMINQWVQGDELFLNLEPKKSATLRFEIRDTPRAGASYRVEAALVYGNRQKPKFESVPAFEIDIVKAN